MEWLNHSAGLSGLGMSSTGSSHCRQYMVDPHALRCWPKGSVDSLAVGGGESIQQHWDDGGTVHRIQTSVCLGHTWEQHRKRSEDDKTFQSWKYTTIISFLLHTLLKWVHFNFGTKYPFKCCRELKRKWTHQEAWQNAHFISNNFRRFDCVAKGFV